MTEIREDIATIGLFSIGIVTIIWGIHAIITAMRNGEHAWPWPPSFYWFLGAFLILTDGVIYALLGAWVYSNGDELDWWEFAIIMQAAIWPIGAFWYWAREKGAP